MVSPSFLAVIFASARGESVLHLATEGSVFDRIQFLLAFSLPFIIGFLGFLSTRDSSITHFRIIKRQNLIFLITLMSYLLLQGIAILLLRPVNGIGQSVYVPFFSFIVSLSSVLLFYHSELLEKDVERGAELFLFGLHTFLFVNIFAEIIVWDIGNIDFLSVQTDSFRFSPFGNVFGFIGRNSFFENDPVRFAVSSLLCFTIFSSSRSNKIRYLGSCLIFVLGSTTQSRIFYIGVIVVIVLKIIWRLAPSFVRQVRIATLLAITGSYIFVMTSRSNSGSSASLSNFNGREYIWDIVLTHWNDESVLFGHLGAYSLYDYCMEHDTRFVFYHAHNLILQSLWEWGLLGVFVMVVLIGYMAVRSIDLPDVGFLLFAGIALAGIIEPSFTLSVLNTRFFYCLVLLKFLFSQKESTKN